MHTVWHLYNFLLFVCLENKLNDFECSWVLMRDTSLLDWQRRCCPLIPLSLRKGTCKRASNGKWEHKQSTLGYLKCPINHGGVSLQHDLKGLHTFSPSMPTEMANYYSDIKPNEVSLMKWKLDWGHQFLPLLNKAGRSHLNPFIPTDLSWIQTWTYRKDESTWSH